MEPAAGGGSAKTCPDLGAIRNSPCQQCKPGTFKDGSGIEKCKQCAVGTYCETGATKEVECEAGTYSADPKRDCTACAAGAYQSQRKQKECVKCKAGEYCPPRSKNPQKCGPGTATTDPTQRCAKCVRGTFAALNGAAACTPCEEGKYQDETGTHVYASACHGRVPVCKPVSLLEPPFAIDLAAHPRSLAHCLARHRQGLMQRLYLVREGNGADGRRKCRNLPRRGCRADVAVQKMRPGTIQSRQRQREVRGLQGRRDVAERGRQGQVRELQNVWQGV